VFVKVVVTTIGSLGDVHPCIALGLELKRRGHEVVIATSEFYRPKIVSTGLGFHSIGPKHLSPEDPELLSSIMDPKQGPENFIRKLLMPHMRGVYDDLLAACSGAKFLITGELVFAAPLVAERLGIGWASLVLAPWQFLSAHDPSIIGPLPLFAFIRGAGVTVNRAMKEFARKQTKSWAEPIYGLRKELGLSAASHPMFEDKNSPYLNLAMFSSAFAKPQVDWPDHTKTVGFAFYDRQNPASGLTDEVRDFLQNGEPPIIFTLGSTAVMNPGSFYTEGKRAAEQLGRRALLLTGKGSPGISGSRDHMVTAYAPYSEIFPYAAVVVHQGGIGTTAQAMRAGCPQFVVPHAFDQPDNAARIKRLGLGLSLRKDRFHAPHAAEQLRKVLGDEKIRAKATQARTFVEKENGAIAAADAVESACR
jgi:rhamnosyltransferase subunit B